MTTQLEPMTFSGAAGAAERTSAEPAQRSLATAHLEDPLELVGEETQQKTFFPFTINQSLLQPYSQWLS